MVRIGLVFSVISVTLMYWAYHEATARPIGNPERWKTMVFTTLCLAQMGHAIAVRSGTRITYQMSPLSNPFVLVAVIITTVLQLMLIYVEPLRTFFGTQVISPSGTGHLLWLQHPVVCLGRAGENLSPGQGQGDEGLGEDSGSWDADG
jgi:Ca2+-transporting ATPase